MDINKAVKLFGSFLNAVTDVIRPLLIERTYTSDEDSINDWLQGNWELLVERKVLSKNEYFEVYGDGADFNGSSSRVTDIKALPTHKIVLKKIYENVTDVLNDEHIQLDSSLAFDRLVGFVNGFYTHDSGFDHVLLNDEDNGIERVVRLENVEFEILKV